MSRCRYSLDSQFASIFDSSTVESDYTLVSTLRATWKLHNRNRMTNGGFIESITRYVPFLFTFPKILKSSLLFSKNQACHLYLWINAMYIFHTTLGNPVSYRYRRWPHMPFGPLWTTALTGDMSVTLARCLRPTEHFSRKPTWCEMTRQVYKANYYIWHWAVLCTRRTWGDNLNSWITPICLLWSSSSQLVSLGFNHTKLD